jgi:hypothetical protein
MPHEWILSIKFSYNEIIFDAKIEIIKAFNIKFTFINRKNSLSNNFDFEKGKMIFFEVIQFFY